MILGTLLQEYIYADVLRSDSAHQIIQLFNQQFGEKYIDIQERPISNILYYPNGSLEQHIARNKLYDIIIKFENETVTNELGQSIKIYDLYVKIVIDDRGTIVHYPSYIRSTFTKSQFRSGYIHSHCQILNRSELNTWKTVCFGTGPIRLSLDYLSSSFDLDRWMGMIAELRQVIKVESLHGGPYIRLNNISDGYVELTYFAKTNIARVDKRFIKSYIRSDRLKLGYINGNYCLGSTFAEWLIDFSEYYKAYKKVYPGTINISLSSAYIKNNKLFVKKNINESPIDYASYIGKPVLTFKGETIKLKILNVENDIQCIEVIDPKCGATILKTLLDILNKKIKSK